MSKTGLEKLQELIDKKDEDWTKNGNEEKEGNKLEAWRVITTGEKNTYTEIKMV